MKNKVLKQRLKNKKVALGSWITIPHQSVIDILAESDFDWLAIDLEHTSIDYNELQILIGFIQSHDIAALVRVSKNEEVAVKRALDAGADGIIVPMVCTQQDARNAVSYSYYPPDGSRGVGLNRAQRFGFGFENYRSWIKDNLTVIAQIEHFEGVNNIEEIIQTEGIDAVFVGPYDLSGSYGIPGQFDEAVVVDALKKVEKTCLDNKFSLGYHVIEPDINLVLNKIESGYNFIAFSTDFLFMGRKSFAEMSKYKETNSN